MFDASTDDSDDDMAPAPKPSATFHAAARKAGNGATYTQPTRHPEALPDFLQDVIVLLYAVQDVSDL